MTTTSNPGDGGQLYTLDDGREATAVEIRVSRDQPGRLDAVLAGRLVRYSRERIQQIIRGGTLTVDGCPVRKPAYRLKGGETVVFLRPLPEGEGPIPEVLILSRTDEILVLGKPGDLTVHPTANALKRTLTFWLSTQGLGEYTPSHRLDRETSGVLVCARRGEASRMVKGFFLEQRVKKGYLALLRGEVPGPCVVDGPIGDDEASPIRVRQTVRPDGAPSSTRFVPLASAPGATLAAILPATGRQHQIRVHAEHGGFPLWGDKMYGVGPEVFLSFIDEGLSPAQLEALRFPRQMLHAAFLLLPLAEGDEIHYWHPPDDFLEAAGQLGLEVPTPGALRDRFSDLLRR